MILLCLLDLLLLLSLRSSFFLLSDIFSVAPEDAELPSPSLSFSMSLLRLVT